MRTTTRFLLKLVLFWATLLALWLAILAAPYGSLLTRGGNLIFDRNPFTEDRINLGYQDPNITGDIAFEVQSKSDDRSGRGNLRFRLHGRRFHFNATIWLALLLATPGWRKKPRALIGYLLGGSIVLLFCQELDLFLQIQNHKLLYMERPEFVSLYQPAGTLEYLLGSLGKYFFLVGRFVVPIVLWLPVGIGAFRASSSAGKPAAAIGSKSVKTTQP